MPAAKAVTKKAAVSRKAAAPKKTAAPKPIGEVTHFFDKISVAVIKLNAALKVGDRIRIEGHGQDFEQAVSSMQIEHEVLKEAKKGQEVGMKVAKPVKAGDIVFKA